MKTVAIIPVKDLSRAKSRLSKYLPLNLRRELTIAMFNDVLSTLTLCNSIQHVIVVTPSDEVKDVARAFKKIAIVRDEGVGQIPAVMKAIDYAINVLNPETILLTVADVPLIRPWNVEEVIRLAKSYNTVVLAPSVDGGTNVMVQHPPLIVRLMYGKSSFYKHLEEARGKKITVRTYYSLETSIDVDTIDDMRSVLRVCAGTNSYHRYKQIYTFLRRIYKYHLKMEY